MSIALALHVLAIVIWVGGMFFAYMALPPAAASTLEPPQRLTLWRATFARFFPWVWISIITVLATGYWMIFGPFGGMANTPIFVHVMQGLGLVMMLIFMHVFFAPYRKLCRAVGMSDWQEGGKQLAQIRVLVGINTLLGIITIVVATAGKFFI